MQSAVICTVPDGVQGLVPPPISVPPPPVPLLPDEVVNVTDSTSLAVVPPLLYATTKTLYWVEADLPDKVTVADLLSPEVNEVGLEFHPDLTVSAAGVEAGNGAVYTL